MEFASISREELKGRVINNGLSNGNSQPSAANHFPVIVCNTIY